MAHGSLETRRSLCIQTQEHFDVLGNSRILANLGQQTFDSQILTILYTFQSCLLIDCS